MALAPTVKRRLSVSDCGSRSRPREWALALKSGLGAPRIADDQEARHIGASVRVEHVEPEGMQLEATCSGELTPRC